MSQTVVFLHGSPGRGSLWDPLIELAPAGTRCVALDLLDHGDAPDAPDATVDDVVDDVVRRVRQLDVPVTLVGHSFGAWAGGRALAQLGDRAARFVAVAGLPGIDADIAARSEGFAAALLAGHLPPEAATAAAADLWLPTTDRDPVHVERIAALVRADSIERLARVLRRQCQLADPARRVARHEVPSVSIHQQGDRGVPIAMGRELAALGPSTEWVELEGDGHYPQWTHRADVARAVFRG
jgi:pimeloyl-ACP methyl ester carboxylesterase